MTQTTWYFAEGSTAAGFDEYLTIANPNDATATVEVIYYPPNSSTIRTTHSVPKGRTTLNVHDTTLPNGGIGRGQDVFGTQVHSTNGVGIIVERPMYFAYSGGGSVWGFSANGGHNAFGYGL